MQQWAQLSSNTPSQPGFAFQSNTATIESQKGLARFFPTLKRELALRGALGFIAALFTTLSETSNDRITRRTCD